MFGHATEKLVSIGKSRCRMVANLTCISRQYGNAALCRGAGRPTRRGRAAPEKGTGPFAFRGPVPFSGANGEKCSLNLLLKDWVCGQKKPTWLNTIKGRSTTSAYSSTSPPARPGYPSSSHPTTSTKTEIGADLNQADSVPLIILRGGAGKARAISLQFRDGCDTRFAKIVAAFARMRAGPLQTSPAFWRTRLRNLDNPARPSRTKT